MSMCGRRGFLQSAGLTALSIAASLTINRSIAADENQAARAKEIEAWMDAWMKRDREVVGTLHLGRFADPVYFLLKPITWKPNADQAGYPTVTVPAGFVTDFASIPRAFWSLLPPDGLYTYPAILHDYLYWMQNTSKALADNILKYGMQEFGVGSVKLNAIYEGVNLGGQGAWNENRRLRETGEKRVLKAFPDDPRMTWNTWKKTPGNFE